MPKLNYSQISELVTSLDLDYTELREAARRRYDLYAFRKEPYVPDEIAREGKVRYLSAHVMHAAETIRADLMMNPTEFTVIPLARERDGTISHPMEQRAENLERALAIIWGRLNEGRRVDRDIIWHQLVSPFGVMILEFNTFEMPDQPEWMSDEAYADMTDTYQRDFLPWSIYLPDPLTCSWIEHDGRPFIFARNYKMLVRDVETFYSKRVGSVNPDANLRLDGDMFRWVSDDYARDISKYRGGFTEVNMLWLDDGEYIYHVAQNPSGNAGEVVWSSPNPIGRCNAFVVPGNTTHSRTPKDKYEPFLLPLMQTVSQMNDIRSTRATAARNLAGPHTYIVVPPETVKLYQSKGERLPTSVSWRKSGETKYLLGDVKAVPSELSPDWDKLETNVAEDLQRFLPSPFVHIVDPAVLKAATATSILHAAETGLRLYGPLMSVYDGTIRDISEAIITDVRSGRLDEDMIVHATGDEMARGRNLEQGSVYRFGTKAVDFPFKLLVRTRSMSQAQAAAQYDLVLRQWILPDGSKGPATLDDLIAAANYTDPVAQRMKLAEESLLSAVDPWLRQGAIQAIKQRIMLDSGIDLSMIQEGGLEAQQPARIPSAAQRMDSPQVVGPQGGSDATDIGAGYG